MTAARVSPFVRETMQAARPAPSSTRMVGWARRRLLGGWRGFVLTILSALLVWSIVPPVFDFLIADAVFTGNSRDDCLAETVGRPVGACWPFVAAKLEQLVYGFYPESERWRVNAVFVVGILVLVPLLMPRVGGKLLNLALFFVVYPVVAAIMLAGGVFGLPFVETGHWGGLTVTLVVSIAGTIVALPLGVLLALGRRSDMPLVQSLCIVFIEFWRGVPLITVLFFAAYMLPHFLPGSWTIDSFLRVVLGVAIFASAYMAEVIRGGLQSVPRGQSEGAAALGLGYWRTMGLVVLPQALRNVIPGIVNTLIGLFKDTTLVMTVSIFDFLGQLRAAFADPNWSTPSTLFTGFAFAGLVYFVFCFGLSQYSLFLERRLDVSRAGAIRSDLG